MRWPWARAPVLGRGRAAGWQDGDDRWRTPLLAIFGISVNHLLSTYGYLAVFLLVGGESLGIPLPGETMLIAAGVYAGSTHRLSILAIWGVASAAAIVGDNIGYEIGRLGGFRLLRRWGRYVRLDEGKLKVGRYIFHRHGGKVVFFGRFVSILRTYAAFLAGTNRMRWLRFFAFNASGGIIWAALYAFGSYLLGTTITSLSHTLDYVLGAVAAVVVVLFLVLLRRKGADLQRRAEEELPGPLDESAPEPQRKG
ncbi:MAG: DedA family protein [Acidimicrobiales bacterium]